MLRTKTSQAAVAALLAQTRRPVAFATRRALSTGAAPKSAARGFTPLQWAAIMGVPAALTVASFMSSTTPPGPKSASAPATAPSAPALDPAEFKPFVVKEVAVINHNTKIIRFALPEGAANLGLPTASAVVVRFAKGTKDDGSPDYVIRAYTPVENPAAGYTGTFDLIVKKYPDGPMSTHIHSLKEGDTLEFKGPIPKIPYKKNELPHIGMIAGGSGITPMIQILQRVLSDPEDKTKVSLIFANVTEEDILLGGYLDKLAHDHPDQLKVLHTLDKPPAGWKGGSGFVSEEMIRKLMPAPGKGKVFFCGPPGMMNFVTGPKGPKFTQGEVGGLMKKLGYTEADVFKF